MQAHVTPPTEPESPISRWKKLDTPVQIAIAVGGIAVGLLFVVKLLPALVAAMGIGVLLAILFVPYWLPSIIGFKRDHPSKGAILALNFFFGWTFIGWVLCLVWALSNNARNAPQQVVVNTIVQNSTTAYAGAPSAPAAQYPAQYQVGDVINGHRFDGVGWQPVGQVAAPAQTPQYRVGDVVNGHRFDGTAWVPAHAAPPAAPAVAPLAPPPPAVN